MDKISIIPSAGLSAVGLGLVFAAAPIWAAPEETVSYDDFVRPFFESHCIECHGPDKDRGDLRLDTLGTDFSDSLDFGLWIEVMDNINLDEMPPDDEPRPDAHDARLVANWIAGELRKAERKALSRGGRVLMRRLNRAEYVNTVEDLLRLDLLPSEDPTEVLPPDGTAEGFDKVSAALMLDPSLLGKYYDVAEMLAEKALVDGPPPMETATVRVDFGRDSEDRASTDLAEGIMSIVRENDIAMMGEDVRMRHDLRFPESRKYIPVEGRYRFRIRAAGDPGESGEPIRMRISQQHPIEDLAFDTVITVEATPDDPRVYEFTAPRDPRSGHWRIEFLNGRERGHINPVYWGARDIMKDHAKEGNFKGVLRLQGRKKLEGGHDGGSLDPVWATPGKLPKLHLDWVEVTGPLYDQWPPKSHEFLMTGVDPAKATIDDARAILQNFMPRAFRRPVEAGEIEPILALVEEELAHEASFLDAIRVGVSAVLTSPGFLYLHEPSASREEERAPLNDWELASRLSYFLWSSMPDVELFELASAGELSKPEVLDAQVARMLEDPKAEAFVEGFGAQWLRTEEFRKFTPDENLYKDYTPELGEAMVHEALSFFREILRSDRPVYDFIDSDWTMLNERLAEFYGIDGVEGKEFRSVPVPAESRRGGLLGMAGVAMHGSDGNRTKPVTRAVYVREVLFNDPPNPPPPNAGEIEPNIKGENLTVRERLIQHKQIESCASCHERLDPYGLALENFNVIGLWREQQDGEDFRGNNTPEIVISGKLPNGKAYESYEEYKALLLEQKDRLVRGLAEKMIIYALGRPVEPTDRSMVDRLTERAIADNYSMKSLIHGLVFSEAFQSK